MSEENTQIAYEILTYLVENPDAQDTLEGIVEWWLLERTIQRQTLEVKESLALLVARGLLIEREGKDARTYYKVNGEKREDILSLLKHSSEGQGSLLSSDE
jgi:hypothetical protein